VISVIPPEFHFLRPWWFATLLPAVLLLFFLWRKKLRGYNLQDFCDPKLLPHLMLKGGTAAKRRTVPLILLAAGWLSVIIGLAGPAWQRLEQPVYTVSNSRVLVLDLSPSMMTSDVKPNRLARAIFKLKDILNRSTEGRTGLVVFGGEAHVVVPLTEDVSTIETMLPALQVDIIPKPGDLVGDALDAAMALLRRGGVKGGDIILLTDGVSDVAAALSTLDKLRSKNIRLSVLAVGTEPGGPTLNDDGVFLTDSAGEVRMSHLDVGNLRELALSGGGVFNLLTSDDDDLDHILNAGASAGLDKANEQLNRNMERWRDEGIWMVPLVLFFAGFSMRRGWILGVAILLFLTPPPSVQAFEWTDMWSRKDQRAAELMEKGDPAGAAELFDDPAWQAGARYEAGDYEKAAQLFKDQVDDPYNLGNSLARSGKLDEALAAYEEALKRNPADKDAGHNRDLIKKIIEQQKQQQKQQQQQNGQDDSGEDQKDSDQQQNQDQQKQGQGKDQEKQNDSQPQDDQQKSDQGEQNESQSGQKTPEQKNQSEEHSQGEQDKSDSGEDKEQGAQGKDADGEKDKPSPQEDEAEQNSAEQKQPEKPKSSDEKDEQKAGRPEKPAGADEKGKELNGAVEDEMGKPLSEEEMAVEQWLRQVPDDPSKLLRRKFMLEHRRNKQER